MNKMNVTNEKLVENLSDRQLDDLLVYAPAFTNENLANIKARTFEKINMPVIAGGTIRSKKFLSKKIAASLAAAIMLLIMSTAVFAAATGLDFGYIFNSFFNNPAAHSMIDVDKTAVNSGIEVTLISVYSDGSHVYAMIAMRDLEAGRIGEDMMLLFGGANAGFASLTTPIVYDQTHGRYLMGIELMGISPAGVEIGDSVSFSIEYILSGVSYDAESGLDMIFYLGESYHYLLSSTVNDIVSGSWNFTFVVTATAERITFTATVQESQYFERLHIEISPMVTTIGFIAMPDLLTTDNQNMPQRMGEYVWSFDYPFFTLKDGSIVELFVNAVSADYDRNVFIYASLYFDMQQLYSITVLGTEYKIEFGGNIQ